MKTRNSFLKMTLIIATVTMMVLVTTQFAIGQPWYNPGWQYRIPITITNTGSALTDYQVQVSLGSSFSWNHAPNNGADLRFIAENGITEIPFWIESWSPSTQSASIWIKVSLPLGTTNIYMYYGNPNATSLSNGNNTFNAYDGFETYTLGTVPTTVPNLSWTHSGSTVVVNNPVRQGVKSVQFTNPSSLTGTFTSLSQGVVGAWMQRSSSVTADFDIYLYGGSSLSCVAGLGQNGKFHYWDKNPSFHDTSVPWSLNTWYFVTLAYNCTANTYQFIVFNEALQEIVHVNGITFGNSSAAINLGMLYTSSGYAGTAFADDYRVCKLTTIEPTLENGIEQNKPNLEPLVINLSGVNVTCYGGSDGSISISSIDGSGSYNYLWSPGGQTSPGISNLAAGNYSVSVYDIVSGRSGIQSKNITQPTAIVVSSTHTEILCSSGLSTLTVSATGGTPGYTYSKDGTNYQYSASFTVTTGLYTVYAKDTKGCIGSASATIEGPAAWFDANWQYRNLVTVTNPGTVTLSDYQVQVRLNAGNFNFAMANNNGSDIRFTAGDGTTLFSYWTEIWNKVGNQADFWVKIPSLPLGETSVYLYYGNPAANSGSNGQNAFYASAYDGFEDYELGSAPILQASSNPGEWTRYPGNPVLVPGPLAWDNAGATFASVIYDDQIPEYRMYYHGIGPSAHQIGLATSPDGKNWTKYAGNPVLPIGPPGSWDGAQTRVPVVWKEGPSDYRMIYTGAGTASGQIGYATSADGINWTKYAGNPVFNDPTWANGQTENWGVMKVDNQYLMWYSSWGTRQAGIAVSTDLINWDPYTTEPIFQTNGNPNDDRYSQFCPFSFKYGLFYYVLVPSYSAVSDYSKFYLYRSSSPYFPESDRHLVRIAHTSQSGGIDATDNDTPFILTTNIERDQFPNNQLWLYYAAEPGYGWREGLCIETDIAAALSDAPLPGAGAGFSWNHNGNVVVVNDPVRQGGKSVKFTNAASLTGSFSSLSQGVVGAWMRRASNVSGDYEIYVYGEGNSLSCVVGLGNNGKFHYWDGSFHETTETWSLNTWYLVTIEFNCTTSKYDFVVYDEMLQEIVHVNGINFGASTAGIISGMLYTSGAYSGTAFADDFRVCKLASTEPLILVGDEPVQIPPIAPVAVVSLQPICSTPTGTITVTSSLIGLQFSIDGLDYSNISGIFNLVPPGSYSVTARNLNGCISAPSNTVTLLQPGCATVNGILKYFNSGYTLLPNVSIKLKQYGVDKYVTTPTGLSGEYSFSNVSPGTYDVEVTTNDTIGGINVTDAAQTNYWGVFNTGIEKVRFYAGDVVMNNMIDGTDASRILQYFLTQGSSGWAGRPAWTFWNTAQTISVNPPASGTLLKPSINVPASGGTTTLNLYALVTGDFNQSFVPGGMKA